MVDNHGDEIDEEALKKAYPEWKKKHGIKDKDEEKELPEWQDPVVKEAYEKWKGKTIEEIRAETQKRIKQIYGLEVKLSRWTKFLNKFRKKNLSYIHICLICGQFNPINVNKYKEDKEDTSGVFYGCMRCDYVFEISERESPIEELIPEDITGWGLKESLEYKRLWLLDRPEEVEMLAYQKGVTHAFSDSYKQLIDNLDKLDKEDDPLDHIYDEDRTEGAGWTDAFVDRSKNSLGDELDELLDEDEEKKDE